MYSIDIDRYGFDIETFDEHTIIRQQVLEVIEGFVGLGIDIQHDNLLNKTLYFNWIEIEGFMELLE